MSNLDTRPTGRNQEVVERAFLIADVRGYTRFTRLRGDAEAARLAGAFADLARDAVTARGGTEVGLWGDEALAVFTSPAQAVRAAIDLVAACAEEVEVDPDLPLLVGVGIDAGAAVPLEDGFRGAAINTASRLCSQAAAGQVLVTADLAGSLGSVHGVDFSPHGTVELKGFEAPVALVRASAAARDPARWSASSDHDRQLGSMPPELDLDIPLAGRERDLSWLRGTWRQARRGDGRLVFVSGPSGIGRTRLAAELASVAGTQGGVVRYVGAGGAAQAIAASELRAAASAEHPTVLILDDMDVLGEGLVSTIESLYTSIETRPVLVACLIGETETIPVVTTLVERADVAGDGHLVLAPLDQEAVRTIAELYAGESTGDVSLESLTRASQGNPGRVHELMSEWAEREAARRLAAAAEWLSAERIDRQTGLEFANNVIGLKLARLYSADRLAGGEAATFCPYMGLASFDQGRSRFFFGREQLVGELAARTVGVGVLAVIGASGSGKSSVIAAGLVPSLQAGLLPGSECWESASIRPGNEPAAELDAALAHASADRRLVLVIDQFEELFAVGIEEAERSAFVEALISAADDPDRFVAVIGLRADFYGHCAAYPELARLMASNQVLVGPMREPELRRVIELPARRMGVRVDSALVDRLVGEVEDEPGGLPLLSTALVELWEGRSGGWLRISQYESGGGVHGAVARLAESSYQQLDERQRVAAHSLFLRLVATGDTGISVRRTVHRSELGMAPDADVTAVVARLTDDRLLTVTDHTIEVAHEALLREWPRLVTWLREDDQGRELREHLTNAAKQWEAAERDPSELYRGARLTTTLDWSATRRHELNDVELAFLAKSRSYAEREADRQRRTNRRLRVLLAGLSLVLVCAVVAGVVAFSQRSRAEERGRLATARELATASQANLEVDPERSLLLALAAARTTQQDGDVIPEATSALHSAVSADRTLLRFNGSISSSPDGRIIINLRRVDGGSELIMLDAGTLRRLATLHSPPLIDAQFSPDSRRLMVATEMGTLLFWDTRTWKRLPPINLNRHVSLGGAAWSPDLRTVALAGDDGIVSLVDTRSGRETRRLKRDGAGYLYVAFSRDGKRVAATMNFGGFTVPIWDVRSGRQVAHLAVDGPSFGIAFSPDGSRIATTGNNGSADVWDANTGRHMLALVGHTGFVWYVAYDADGQRIATAGNDGTARIWDANDGQQMMVLHGHAGDVYGVHFSPTGRWLQTYGADQTGRIWDISPGGGHELLTLDGSEGFETVQFSPDGSRLLAAQFDGAARQWDSATGQDLSAVWTGGGGAAFSPDGRRFATGGWPTVWDAGSGSPVRDLALRHNDAHWTSNIAYSRDGSLIAGALGNTTPGTGTVAVWEAGSGRRVATLGKPQGKYDAVKQVVFSPDSTLLAGITEAGRLHVWRMAGGREILSRMVVNGGGNGVSFSPDSALVAASGSTGVSIWNTADGARVARLPGAANVQAVQFSPDGTELATGGQDQTIRIWDVSTNRTILTLTGHSATINSVAFSPDGTRVASASDDRTVRVYDLDTERLIRIAQSRLTRHLTLAECRQYLHTDSCTSSDGGAHTAQRGLWTTSATDDSAPVGAYRLTVLPSDFPPGYEAAEDRIGVYTLSLEMGRWRLFQLKPSGETWETSGTYRVGPGRRLFLTDRGDPGCYGMAMSANWSRAGTLLSFSNARATMTPTCEPGASNTMRARGLLASRPWSSVVV